MKLSSKSWSDYITKLSQINKSAADKMRAWVEVNGTNDAEAMIRYAYALVTKYGEASSALACEMYDAMAELEKVSLPAAEPAPTATYKETAKAINGAALRGAGMIPGVVDRLTKQAGQDTTVHNAIRDGAEWAWIPKGDTCAFCITLASNGWQRASVGLLRGNHAEHIHANCDCAFAIRHGKDGDVAGYNPEQYLLAYRSAEGTKPSDKINAMRRVNYRKNKAVINEQKRIAYARRQIVARDIKTIADVPEEKLVKYLLNPEHPVGKHKARVFESALGFNINNYSELNNQMLEKFNEAELKYTKEDEYGKRYEQVMNIHGVNGRDVDVLTVWIKDNNSKKYRLITAMVVGK